MPTLAKSTWKIVGYGLLMYIVWQLLSFIAALATGTQGKDAADVDFNSLPLALSGVVIALLMAGAAYWFCRTLRLDTKRDALAAGVIWIVILVALQIFTTIPYDTTKTLFSAWAMYLPYVAILLGARSGTSATNGAPPTPPVPPAAAPPQPGNQ